MISDPRYEVKFVLSERELGHALRWMTLINAKMIFETRTVNSIYFDDTTQTAVRENLSGVSERRKIRLRWYGNNDLDFDGLKVEVKSRVGRLGYKSSYPIPFNHNYLINTNLHTLSKEVIDEIVQKNFSSDFFNRYLVPMLYVNYSREYYSLSDGIRVTIDKNISFSSITAHQNLSSLNSHGYNSFILEIKFPQNFKTKVVDFIRPLRLTPKRHSKYLAGLAYLGLARYL